MYSSSDPWCSRFLLLSQVARHFSEKAQWTIGLRRLSRISNSWYLICVIMTNSLFPTTGPSIVDLKRHARCEFLAGDEVITIVPSFSHPKPLELISVASVGPFTAGIQVQVPIWLGTLLKQKSLCRMQAPPWMEVDNLLNILKYSLLICHSDIKKFPDCF